MSDTVQAQPLNPQAVSEDIAFLRALAVEGQKTPYRGGISLAAGAIWGTASLYSWSVVAGGWNPPGGVASANWSWLAATVAFGIVGIPLGMYRRKAGSNRAAVAAWGGVGLACWTVSVAVAVAALRTHQGVIFTVLPPMIMALYGGGWLVGAVVFRARWQRWVGALSLLSSLLLAYTAGQPLEYLLFALCLYLLAGLPGLIAVLRARAGS
jgi:hypothetical protein